MTETLLSIPLNVLDLRDNDFFMFIGQFCSQDVVEYLKLLGVRSVDSLLGIDDIFLPLQEDYLELIDVKKKLAFRRSDGSYVIKIGVQYDINELTKNLRNVLISKGQMTNDLGNEKELILKPEVFQQHPFLKRLIDFYNSLSQNPDSTNENFLHRFLDNLLSNLPTAKSRYRYQEDVLDFALCLFISAGRNAYEFLRINIPGALPSLTTIQTKLAKEGLRALEGEFRYNDMIKYMSTVNSKFAFCAEDCTTAERKIIYDSRSNSFVGFSPPLDEYGIPRMKYFQTDSIEDLQCWFEQEDISKLLNLYMVQPINSNDQKISPYALAAYGTNGKYTSFDIIRRWFKVFEESSSQGIRIIGYSTDADAKYLLGMRLVSGFFATLLNSPISKHSLLLTTDIPKSWSWFFLPRQQLFLCMQDAIHICTKLRNRLLSTSAVIMMGDGLVSIDYLLQLIELRSKFHWMTEMNYK
ncbi:unnamed protein product [Rotaria socialis]|nr:unnamed protein product [Rotaria socialis]CAF3341375.1 unnamed protein product [Rotaria socialis]CAF4522845.1 unnamed protein product [Rotaria socialis]CAF4643223.1 unnamed protein product [Rotaria socialis]